MLYFYQKKGPEALVRQRCILQTLQFSCSYLRALCREKSRILPHQTHLTALFLPKKAALSIYPHTPILPRSARERQGAPGSAWERLRQLLQLKDAGNAFT